MVGSIVVKGELPVKVAGTVVGLVVGAIVEVVFATFVGEEVPIVPDPFIGIVLEEGVRVKVLVATVVEVVEFIEVEVGVGLSVMLTVVVEVVADILVFVGTVVEVLGGIVLAVVGSMVEVVVGIDGGGGAVVIT